MEDPAAKYFTPKVTDRDRAVFEAGIAIGTIVHQFTGVPVKKREDVAIFEELIKRSISAQPFRLEVDVKVSVETPVEDTPYNYVVVQSRHIDAKVVVKYGKCRVTARLRHIPELNYTLGYIEDIEEST